jgi:hypothetical protein
MRIIWTIVIGFIAGVVAKFITALAPRTVGGASSSQDSLDSFSLQTVEHSGLRGEQALTVGCASRAKQLLDSFGLCTPHRDIIYADSSRRRR